MDEESLEQASKEIVPRLLDSWSSQIQRPLIQCIWPILPPPRQHFQVLRSSISVSPGPRCCPRETETPPVHTSPDLVAPKDRFSVGAPETEKFVRHRDLRTRAGPWQIKLGTSMKPGKHREKEWNLEVVTRGIGHDQRQKHQKGWPWQTRLDGKSRGHASLGQ